METIFQFLVETIFHGAFILTLFLLIAKIFKVKIGSIESKKLIASISVTSLLGSLIYVTLFLTWLFGNIFSGGEYVQYTVSNRPFGPYWWAFWVFLFLPYWFLPQIFWFRKFRRSITAVLLVTLIWEVSFAIRTYSYYGLRGVSFWQMYYLNEWSGYLIKFLADLLIVSIVYFAMNLKGEREIKTNLQSLITI